MSRILVVGHSLLIAEGSRLILETKGFKLLHCAKTGPAIAIILEDPPDLLVVEKGFAEGGDLELIKVAKACLHKANMPIILVLPEEESLALDWENYPVDDIICPPVSPEVFLARVLLAESRMARVFDNNPLSRLPGNTSIIKAISRTLGAGSEFAVCYVDIDNFKPYNDRYGFSRGDEVIVMVARLMVNVVGELAGQGSFVGHVGGDDFVFIVAADRVEVVCRKIIDNFTMVRNMFLNAEDLRAGRFVGQNRQGNETVFDLLSISIAVVILVHGKFKHYGEVSSTASQLKHCVKKLAGSNYIIDRREAYHPDA